MRELLYFALAASILGAVFIVSLIELILTIRRRKVQEELEEQVRKLRTHYKTSDNNLVLDDEQTNQDTQKQLETITARSSAELDQEKKDYQTQLQNLQDTTGKELASAQARAKKLEKEARMKADEYLASRQNEVEQQLMNLVMAVTKKVLPSGITYDMQKSLVMQALQDVKAEKESVA
jgi:flagellar biosynthesis/type III secretory pathway protein FliH